MSELRALSTASPLSFGSPLSPQRAQRLVDSLSAAAPATIVDIGCGWGELLLQLLAANPEAAGIGYDTDALDLARGRDNAARRGLSDRVTFVEKPGAEYTEPADLVLCVGSSHVYGEVSQALERLRGLVKPGGRLLFADGFWEHPPSPDELANMWPGATADDHTSLGGLVDQTTAAGFLPLWVETVNRDEWEFFESGFIADEAQWMLINADSPLYDQVSERVARFRTRFVTGCRDIFGFAYLTLGVAE